MNDILLKNITAVTMDDSRKVIDNAYVAISGSRISYVGEKRPEGDFKTVLRGRGKVVMPGLVNTHAHLAMTLLRSYADDMNLQDWLFNKIFPFEDTLTEDMIKEGSEIGIDEMLASGTTCFNDMYFFEKTTAEAVLRKGIRAVLAEGINFDGYDRKIKLTEELNEEYGGEDLISLAIAPHAIYTCSEKLLRDCAEYAREHNVLIHTHLAETKTEFDDCIKEHGMTPTAYMESVGMFESKTVAAHCVYMTDEDINILKKHGVTAAHNVVSNLKLASGVAPVTKMLERGVNVSLGTDGASSNNNLDMFEEMKISGILHKGITLDPTVLDAWSVLKMATVNGAKALGFDDLGMLKEGYLADMAVIDFDAPHLTPNHNTVSNLVYAARGSDVEYTIVNGKIVYKRSNVGTRD